MEEKPVYVPRQFTIQGGIPRSVRKGHSCINLIMNFPLGGIQLLRLSIHTTEACITDGALGPVNRS